MSSNYASLRESMWESSQKPVQQFGSRRKAEDYRLGFGLYHYITFLISSVKQRTSRSLCPDSVKGVLASTVFSGFVCNLVVYWHLDPVAEILLIP